MRRFPVQQTLIVLISCVITIGEIQWVSSTVLRDGVPVLRDCLAWEWMGL
jgi:hypothetical protein